MNQTEAESRRDRRGHTEIVSRPKLANRIASGQQSSVSLHLDAPDPIVVTDSRNRVTQMNGHFASAVKTSLAESVGQNVLDLVARKTASGSAQADGSIRQSNREIQSGGLRLSFVTIASSDQLVWRISQPESERSNTATRQIRIDPAGHVATKPANKAALEETVIHSREEVLTRLEEDRLRSLVPRLTSLVGHLDLAMLCVGSLTVSQGTSESQLARSIHTARNESDRIAAVVREIRGIRQSTAPVRRQQSLRFLFDRATGLLSTELDSQDIDLQCSSRMKDQSVMVIVDGVAVCQSVLWLVRTAAVSLDQNDRFIQMDGVIDNGALKLGVSFTPHEIPANQVTAASGSLSLTSNQPEMDDSECRLASPPVQAKWTRKNFPNGRSTIGVAIPCIRGDR